MKFLAILKDSFREAIDSKVLYVMVGISLVVILLVGSISYKPMPAEQAFPAIVEQFRWERDSRDQKKGESLFFQNGSVSDIRQLTKRRSRFWESTSLPSKGLGRAPGQPLTSAARAVTSTKTSAAKIRK